MDLQAILQPSDQAWSQEAKLLFPEDEAFPSTTERWSIAHPPTFAASITVGSIEDVQVAVKRATSHSIPLMATSGRHGYCSRLAELQGGLQIDLSGLDHVKVNPETSAVTVGPGAQFKDVVEPLFKAGKEMTFGFCSTVSVVGATLGGGVGRYQAFHGLLIDQLVSARVVTASGDLITASATENADLFWALRGAGVFFGIVVEATYQVFDLTNNGECQDSTLVYPLTAAEPVLKALTTLDERGAMSRELMISAAFAWEPRMNAAVFMIDFIYPGPSAPFQALLQAFLDLNPLVNQTQTLPITRIFSDGALGLDAVFTSKSQLNSVYGMCTKRIDVRALVRVAETLMSLYETHPAARTTSVSIEWYASDVVRAVPADATAYAWRDTKAYFLLQASYTPSEDPAADAVAKTAANDWARSSRAVLAQASGFNDEDGNRTGNNKTVLHERPESRQHRVFLSYANGDETPEQIFGGEKLARLRNLKKTWDPANVFRWGPAIF